MKTMYSSKTGSIQLAFKGPNGARILHSFNSSSTLKVLTCLLLK